MLDPRHAPRFEKTPGVNATLLALMAGAICGSIGGIWLMWLAWGLHWVVACG